MKTRGKSPFVPAILAAMMFFLAPGGAKADPLLSDFDYPYPVERYQFVSQGAPVFMSYMDIAPENPNGRTVALLHGKNFCAVVWEETIAALTGAGYRVIAPDQIGFCKSSKPRHYQYGLHQLAANTNALLSALGVDDAIIMGHSMGGMLAARYALMYPEATQALVMVNPIGLEDWKAKGVPAVMLDELYAAELGKTEEGIRAYQKETYYAGEWRARYDRWVRMLAGMHEGEGREIVAWAQARTSDMVFMQPVVYEFPDIAVPTLLLIGERDITAIGKTRVPEEARGRLGDYPALARETQARIPNARLHLFPEFGHAPQIQAPDEFHDALLEGLEAVLGEE